MSFACCSIVSHVNLACSIVQYTLKIRPLKSREINCTSMYLFSNAIEQIWTTCKLQNKISGHGGHILDPASNVDGHPDHHQHDRHGRLLGDLLCSNRLLLHHAQAHHVQAGRGGGGVQPVHWQEAILTSHLQTGPPPLVEEWLDSALIGRVMLAPAIFCHKEPARASKAP